MDHEFSGAGVGVGPAAAEQMRAAREASGLSLTEIATRTRVPLRHLEALERGDYASLPGVTYCTGFARAYARAVGMDANALVSRLRAELEDGGEFAGEQRALDEPADPARVPPRALAWTAALAALLVAGGYALWRMQVNSPPTQPDAAAVVQPVRPSVSRRPAAPVNRGPVVLTAIDDVWLRIYDGGGQTLYQDTLKKGASYTVPPDADRPMILTGRPDAISVTVGGRAIPPLGTGERTISDVPVTPEALLARASAPADAPSAAAVPKAASPQPALASPPAASSVRSTGSVQSTGSQRPSASTNGTSTQHRSTGTSAPNRATSPTSPTVRAPAAATPATPVPVAPAAPAPQASPATPAPSVPSGT